MYIMNARVILIVLLMFLSVSMSFAQQTDSIVSKPCLCTTFRWSDIYGWTDPLVDSFEYNDHGDIIKNFRTAHTGYRSIRVYHPKNAPELSEQFTYHIDPKGDTTRIEKHVYTKDEDGNLMLSEYFELKENNYQRKARPEYLTNVSFTIEPNGNVASSTTSTFEALLYFHQTHRIFGYDEQGRLIYMLRGERSGSNEEYRYDSTVYDISEVLSAGILTSYTFYKDTTNAYHPYRKVLHQFEAFKFPDTYITGDEYFDVKNRQVMEREYHWAQEDTCYISWPSIPKYTNCNTCHWLEFMYSKRTEHLPNDGTVRTEYFKDLFVLDSLRTEKDEHGNITRRLRVNYWIEPCGEPVNCQREYVQHWGSLNETIYERTYDQDGNEVDQIWKLTDPSTKELINFQRKQCTAYRSFPISKN